VFGVPIVALVCSFQGHLIGVPQEMVGTVAEWDHLVQIPGSLPWVRGIVTQRAQQKKQAGKRAASSELQSFVMFSALSASELGESGILVTLLNAPLTDLALQVDQVIGMQATSLAAARPVQADAPMRELGAWCELRQGAQGETIHVLDAERLKSRFRSGPR
jgi:CheW-like domain